MNFCQNPIPERRYLSDAVQDIRNQLPGTGTGRKERELMQKAGRDTVIDGRQRRGISPGLLVWVELKRDQGTGRLTEGRVKEVLTGSSFHPHGIKVRLEDGQVGRVKQTG